MKKVTIMRITLEKGFIDYEYTDRLSKDHHLSRVDLARVIDSSIAGFPGEFVIKRPKEVPSSLSHLSAKSKRYNPCQALQNEAAILEDCVHQHIITSFGKHEDAIGIELCLEYLPDKLHFYQGALKAEGVLHLIEQMSSALTYLHAKQYAHFDIKLGNIGLKGRTFKLLDFGIAKYVNNQGFTHPDKVTEGTVVISRTDPQKRTIYIAPEILKEYFYSTAADCYSLGVCLNGLCYDPEKNYYYFKPFDQFTEQEKPRNSFEAFLNGAIKQLLEEDPIKRMTAQQLLNDTKMYRELTSAEFS